ncbi:hypothetical protein [Micromonospora sp. CB01531]|uniref:hypothetical protein n=1 Tax=Micromonospora sp. CB01531 TaxID=1718947 RepID=UPI00093F01BB|nr:hypothetical protein [Micromonospora sp. CB01531]OKI54561.1 hypothetical protein A6A27_32050 [Micromonospora sp. CB01531]
MKELSTLEAFDDVVAKISHSVARDSPCVDSEDISQHLYLTILQNREHFKNPDAAGVTNALWRIAKQYATQLRAEALHLSPQYAYCTEDVRKILEHTFDQSEWYDTRVPEDARSIKDSADELDLQSDIKWGWSQLHTEDQRLVFRRYALKEDFGDSERRKFNRAIEKLVDVVNTYPRPGFPRRAMTNTRAQHVIGSGYE